MRPKVTERGWEIPIGMLPLRWREHMIRVFNTDEWLGVIIIGGYNGKDYSDS